MKTEKEYLEKKLGLFREMKTIAEKQKEFASRDMMKAFTEATSRRGHLQNKITADDKCFMHKATNNKSANGRDAISGKISEVIKSIQEVDREIETFIQEKKDGTALELKNIKQGKKAVKGYGYNRNTNPRFISREW